jgi:hypothetical protein
MAGPKREGIKIPKEDGPCGRDMQGTKLVRYQGKCMHPNEVRRLKSRASFKDVD